MNDLVAPAKLLFWAASAALVLGPVLSLGKVAYSMAEMAIEAQSHPMSYGKFSRLLWSEPSKRRQK
jgi:hypothetical protein